jgi:outer membrane protein assembly factor BamB
MESSAVQSTYLENFHRTGLSSNSITVRGNCQVLAEYSLPAAYPSVVETMPAVDVRGNVYFGAHDGIFYSLDKEFKLRWIFNTQSSKVYSSPTVDGNNRVYFASTNNQGYCLEAETGQVIWRVSLWNPTGKKQRWKIKRDVLINLPWYSYFKKQWLSSRCWSSPLVGEVYTYWVGSITGLIATSRNTGDVKWVYDLGFPRNYWSSPCMGANGDLFASGQCSVLHCVDATSGKCRWTVNLRCKNDIIGSLSYDSDKRSLLITTYGSKRSGKIYSVSDSGAVKWVQCFDDGFRGGVAIANDYYVAVGSSGIVYKLSTADGGVVKKVRVANPRNRFGLWTNPIIAANSFILVGTIETDKTGRFVCLDKDLSEVGSFNTGKVLSPGRILGDGSVLFGAWDGTLRRICF